MTKKPIGFLEFTVNSLQFTTIKLVTGYLMIGHLYDL